MQCPQCGSNHGSKVVNTYHDSYGGIRRRRACKACGTRFITYERVVTSIPLLVKRDGHAEEFDRKKLAQGIHFACGKRLSPAEVNALVDDVESALENMGRAEVPSWIISDLVVNSLRRVDKVGYIRYAVMQLGTDLDSVSSEIDRLLAANGSTSKQ